MKKVCAWCKKTLGQVNGNPLGHFTITHGICRKCRDAVISSSPKDIHDFLDKLPVPVILIEPGLSVRTANQLAQNVLGKDLDEIMDHSSGDVLGCIYSKKPGGCGKDIHCKSCAIKHAVTETFKTGKGFKDIPAYPDFEFYSSIKHPSYRISTEKFGYVVLLSINEVSGT